MIVPFKPKSKKLNREVERYTIKLVFLSVINIEIIIKQLVIESKNNLFVGIIVLRYMKIKPREVKIPPLAMNLEVNIKHLPLFCVGKYRLVFNNNL